LREDQDSGQEWDTGPVSRPYTVTGGRTRPRGEWKFDLVDMVARTAHAMDTTFFTPERSRILQLCYAPISVAEVSAGIGLPLGVVRVLLDDLLHENMIEVRVAAQRGIVTDTNLLGRVLSGLRAL
jgi:hypothetical protein